MLFNSPQFIFIFLPAVLLGYALLARWFGAVPVMVWLASVSLYFYAYWNPPYLALLGTSIAVNFMLGRMLIVHRSRLPLVLGLVFNLGLIAYFKYAGFFVWSVDSVTGLSFSVPATVLPLAISFFTFQKIALLVDIYRGQVRELNLLHYVVFVSFFPQLIAGPIVHYGEIVPQFRERRDWGLKWRNLICGATIFLIGLEKKVVCADGVAVYANTLFNEPAVNHPGFATSWIGVTAFAFQIYFDFSGYTDMAVGLARMFGITLPENFNSPYKATSIIEFWRRWHMTLSRFLRDYLYIPLGGNRRGEARRYLNLLITMLLGGLWHGAAWTFVFWGFLHGLYLSLNHLWHRLRGPESDGTSSLAGRLLGWGLTQLAVIIAWVFFRAASWDDAINILRAMMGLDGGLNLVIGQAEALAWICFLAAVVLFLPNRQRLTEPTVTDERLAAGLLGRLSLGPAVAVMGAIALLIVWVRGSGANDFIYMVF